MNHFAKWMKANHKFQKGVAEELGISQSSLHDILKKGHTPSLKVAYKIEKYTRQAVTFYDWIDEKEEKKKKN